MKFQLKYPTDTTTLIVLTATWFYYVALDYVCLDVSEERAASIFTFSHPKDWGSKPLRNIGRSALHYKVHSYNKSQTDALFLKFILVKNSMFRRDLLSIIRSFNTVYTAIGICHASYVECLLARSGSVRNMYSSLPK